MGVEQTVDLSHLLAFELDQALLLKIIQCLHHPATLGIVLLIKHVEIHRCPGFGTFAHLDDRRDELLPLIKRWSPDHLLHKDAAPMFFENEWGQTKPDDVTQANYDVHCPRWALGFQKLALVAGAVMVATMR